MNVIRGLLFVAVIAVLTTACKKDNIVVVMETSQGEIQLELFPNEAPITVENFLLYADSDFYNGTIFHRVIKGFMIQGGGFTSDLGIKSTLGPIKNEADNGLLNKRGTIAMARTSKVDSATSEFFINLKDNTFLDHGVRDFGYCVFGRVIKGMDVVDKIASIPVRKESRIFQAVPEEEVVIHSVQRLKNLEQ